ncbi:MAG: sugar ABC transporter substrate-binding protein, partial [Anaerolineae bacterium]|nr:sugar ABC transporter substrate-binding protein [Anaerolineae bacterium]
MRKLILSLISMLVITMLVLSACGTPAEPTTEPQEEPPEAAALAVGIVLPTKDEPRWIQDETRFQDALTAA